MKKGVALLSLFFSLGTGGTAWGNSAAATPDALVMSVVQTVIEKIKHDPSVRSNLQRASEYITATVVPYFNFPRMTALALGLPWRQATPSQRARLSQEFQTLLVRTYIIALSQYTDQQVKILHTTQKGQEAQVKTLIVGSTMKDLNVDYRLYRAAGQWKIYDISVMGVSLVLNYRQQFQAQVRQQGMEGLVKILHDKNRAMHKSSRSQ